MFNPKSVKLGALPSHPSSLLRCLKLKDYFSADDLPPLPTSTSYRAKYNNPPMFKNSELGCCTCAAKGHVINAWTYNSGQATHPNDSDIVSAYNRINGGQDNGASLIDALDDWRKTPMAGSTLDAYAMLQKDDQDDWRNSINLFGSVYWGVQLPVAWQGATSWDVPIGTRLTGKWAPGSWGGHCINAVDYDADGVWIVTWGDWVHVTWKAIKYFGFEAYALLDDLWFKGTKSVSGFDAELLEWDMKAITGQNPGPKPTPIVPPPPIVPPTPPPTQYELLKPDLPFASGDLYVQPHGTKVYRAK